MLLPERLSPSQLTQLFETVQTTKPAYAEICSLFEKIFSLQEDALSTCRPPVMSVDETRLDAQRQGGLPLVERGQILVDWPSMESLFQRLCEAALGENDYLAAAAATLLEKWRSRELALEHFGTLLITDDMTAFERQAVDSDLQPEVLALLTYHSIWPSAAIHLNELKPHLPDNEDWQLGYCPFCGSHPMLSLLAEDGGRSLVCSFCRYTWAVPRLFCPYCDNRDAESLGYFFSEAEPEYRVHTCQKCKSYLKSIDLRQLLRPFHPFLEAAITAHLDMRAREDGYLDRTPVWVHIG